MNRYACPDCHSPINLPKRGKDARCGDCRRTLWLSAVQNGAKWAKRRMRKSVARKSVAQ